MKLNWTFSLAVLFLVCVGHSVISATDVEVNIGETKTLKVSSNVSNKFVVEFTGVGTAADYPTPRKFNISVGKCVIEAGFGQNTFNSAELQSGFIVPGAVGSVSIAGAVPARMSIKGTAKAITFIDEHGTPQTPKICPDFELGIQKDGSYNVDLSLPDKASPTGALPGFKLVAKDVEEAKSSPADDGEKTDKGDSSTIIIIICSVVGFLIVAGGAGVGGYFAYRHFKKPKNVNEDGDAIESGAAESNELRQKERVSISDLKKAAEAAKTANTADSKADAVKQPDAAKPADNKGLVEKPLLPK